MNDFEIEDSFVLNDRGVVVTGMWQRSYKPPLGNDVTMNGFCRRIKGIERHATAEPSDWTGQKIGLLI